MSSSESSSPRLTACIYVVTAIFVELCSVAVHGQSTASIEGRVTDPNGATVQGVEVTAISRALAIARNTRTDDAGRYQITALPVGDYRLEVRRPGFANQVTDHIQLEVARRAIQDFQLKVGEVLEAVTVPATHGLIEESTVCHVFGPQMVQETPLNGRYFLDFALLVPSSVTPSQSGFSTVPSRGVGALVINTAGNREETESVSSPRCFVHVGQVTGLQLSQFAGVVVQNSYDLGSDRGLSDFDARHRVVVSTIYELPFRGNRFIEGWQMGVIFQAQSASPVNIVTNNSTLTGIANTVRPDVSGPISITGDVDRWFDTSVFISVGRFGPLGRNVVIGPGFNITDFSIIKNTKLCEGIRMQFRTEVFDLFNHPSFGQPGRVVGTQAFGRVCKPRFPTGDSGSSRQMQLR